MKNLKKFSIFEYELTPEQVNFLDAYTEGTWNFDKITGFVNIEGNFNCYGESIKNIEGINFGNVTGNFWVG